MKLSILIKAFNEEALIANCLEAALTEALKVGGEVILVDSLSTDRTVEIARCYPIRIIQFSQKIDCGCAAAVQLGYQYAYGEYLCVLDGDMVLQPDFLSLALNYLESNSDVAGVAGKLLDTSIKTMADKRRRAFVKTMQQQVMEVSELGGGGLFRESNEVKYSFITQKKKTYSAGLMCQLMGVSRSAYYDYVRCTDKCSANPCHEEILETVRDIAKFSNYSYGSRRIGKALNALGYPVGRWKARSLMWEAEMQVSESPRAFRR